MGATTLPEDVIPIVRSVAAQSTLEIGVETPLLSSGYIDSFSVAELALALSSAFDVEVPLEELGVDNADTCVQLAALVNGLR